MWWSFHFGSNSPTCVAKYLSFPIAANAIDAPDAKLLITNEGLICPLTIQAHSQAPLLVNDLVARKTGVDNVVEPGGLLRSRNILKFPLAVANPKKVAREIGCVANAKG